MFCTRIPQTLGGGPVFIPSSVVWMCLLFGITGLAVANTRTDLQAEIVLRHAASQYAERPAVLHDSDAVVTWPDREFEPGERTKLHYVSRFIQDGDRVDGSTRLLETVEGKETPFKDSRQIWDGSMYLHRTKSPSMYRPNAYVTADGSNRATFMQYERKDSFLDGILPTFGDDHYANALLNTAELTLRGQMEEIGGHACYVVEATRREGESCTFWIDPAAGYNLRKAVIRSRQIGDPPKPQPGKKVLSIKQSENVIYDVTIEQVGGMWFSVSGTYEQQWPNRNGGSHHSKRQVRRDNIVWNPDLQELGAFKIDLPEGTRFTNSDDPSNEYVWRNGGPEKVNQVHTSMVGRQAPPLAVDKWYNDPSAGLVLKDKIVLLDFFGIWCQPCMAKIPLFKELHEQYSDQGLAVVGVHTAEFREKIPAFISRERIKYFIAVDKQGRSAEAFNVFFYPTVVLIDREGTIMAVNPSETELKGLLKLHLRDP